LKTGILTQRAQRLSRGAASILKIDQSFVPFPHSNSFPEAGRLVWNPAFSGERGCARRAALCSNFVHSPSQGRGRGQNENCSRGISVQSGSPPLTLQKVTYIL